MEICLCELGTRLRDPVSLQRHCPKRGENLYVPKGNQKVCARRSMCKIVVLQGYCGLFCVSSTHGCVDVPVRRS